MIVRCEGHRRGSRAAGIADAGISRRGIADAGFALRQHKKNTDAGIGSAPRQMQKRAKRVKGLPRRGVKIRVRKQTGEERCFLCCARRRDVRPQSKRRVPALSLANGEERGRGNHKRGSRVVKTPQTRGSRPAFKSGHEGNADAVVRSASR